MKLKKILSINLINRKIKELCEKYAMETEILVH